MFKPAYSVQLCCVLMSRMSAEIHTVLRSDTQNLSLKQHVY